MGVEFEENHFGQRDFSAPTPKIAAWIIRKGWAKDVAGANLIQIIASIIFFALAAYFAFF